ncbi:class I SAM-dependent methyltransferase [Chiayiivirga flava]|uniref:SAM-dependent MidA family methyltransferase n=1 Tax=Chiayiivirga flava TaxID=659595 RepID=A0A7W8D8T2_9GAMM|nr:SAM-dependent MidA family methyltransferase [Chiayiivirga flava]
MRIDLPPPDTDALAHSARLRAAIAADIAANGGSIPFSRFMELALYAPGLGYYSAGSHKFGAGGDFVTAPELGPLFAQCVAEAVAPVLRQIDGGGFFELGGGSGAFAADVLWQLAERGALPVRYGILEPSADLRERQQALLRERLPIRLFERIDWLDGPPERAWSGVLFANEVLDALPTPRFARRDGEIWEEHVVVDAGGALVRVDRPADALLRAAVRHVEEYLGAPLPEGYRSELLPQLPYWIQAVGGLMRQGAMLFVDYGYARREYYDSARTDGTLRAFYRQRMHADPLLHPGLQDITASVDFTALAEAGTNAGFDMAGYCSQASFLLGNGLMQRFEALHEQAPDEAVRYALAQQVKRLTLPGEMGERFQAMGFVRDVQFGHAFLGGDMSWRL